MSEREESSTVFHMEEDFMKRKYMVGLDLVPMSMRGAAKNLGETATAACCAR